MEKQKHKSISDCLSESGFSCKSIPISDHSKLEVGIRLYASQFNNEEILHLQKLIENKEAFIEILEKQIETERAKTAKLKEALEEAKVQIEYMHSKFKETGSGNAVLSQITEALTQHKEKGGNGNGL